MLLFLGSGVSIPSGLPGVPQLTAAVLSENLADNFINNLFSEEIYLRRQDSGEMSRKVNALLRLLYELDKENLASVGCYWSGNEFRYSGPIYRNDTTYEDIIALVKQIRWRGEGFFDDAPSGAFVDLVERRAKMILPDSTREARLVSLYNLARFASQFIEFTVSDLLSCSNPKGLKAIVELARADKLDIVTLNHDTLVECTLRNSGVDFYDGFGTEDGDVRWPDAEFRPRTDGEVRLIKPHGSIDWRLFHVNGAILVGQVNWRLKHGWKDQFNNKLSWITIAPVFLTGNNKDAAYSSVEYFVMSRAFHQALIDNDVVVISGYGWGDTGINRRLESWLDQSSNRRLILLHQAPSELLKGSITLDRSFQYWVDKGKLKVIEKWLCDVSARELIQVAQSV